jgi:CubicO group peptidase (beta-lactamase class C family)
MHDSQYVLPPALRARRVYRDPDAPAAQAFGPWLGGLDSAGFDETDWGSDGVSSTAADLAIFLQMLLNGGAYGGRQILSPASVAAMIHRQVVSEQRGGYGYGLVVFGTGSRYRPNGALTSQSAFGHGGYGSCYIWADPERDLVGVYLFASPRLHRGWAATNSDLFQNAVHAAIID